MLTQRRKETGKPGSGMLCSKFLEKKSSKHLRTPVREKLLYMLPLTHSMPKHNLILLANI